MKTLLRCTGITALLAILVLGFSSGMAWAAYEVTNIVTSVPTVVQPQQGPLENLQVSWDKPTVVGGTLVGYVYIWNNSATLLDDTQLNQTTNDGTVPNLDSPFLDRDKEDFANDDYDVIWYLHIKTFYLDFVEGEKLSSDVAVGPFNFDNVAPTGTVALDTSVPGQTATTSSVNPVTLSLTSAADVETVYLGNSSTFAQATASTFANTLTFEVLEGSGSKTIYTWFEDQVGNVSTAPGTLTFTLFEGKTMSPSGDVPVELDGTQTFTILGAQAGETFDWVIIEADPVDVASFVGAPTDVVTVEVSGDNEGTFKLQATSNTDAAVYTSGILTVAPTSISKVFDLITTATTNTNTIGFIFENTGITTAHELGTAVGNCTQVAKWNAATQSYLSHRMQFPTLNNFALNVGEAYFVTITDAHQFTLTGQAPTSHSQSLITTATTNTNAIGVPNSKSSITTAHDLGLDIGNCSQVSKWNATTQSYLSHRMQFPTLNNFQIEWGQGYFITVTQETNWPW